MAIVFNAPQDRFGIQGAGSVLAQALMQNAQDSILERRQLGQNQASTNQLNQQNQFLIDKENRQNNLVNNQNSLLGQSLAKFDITKPEGQIGFIQDVSSNGGNVDMAFELIKQQNNNLVNQLRFNPANQPAKVSDLRKNLNKDIANTIKTSSQIDSAASDLDRLQELSQSLTGASGYAKSLLGTQEAAEFDALGLSTLSAPLKIFNPVGAIPVQKIKILEKKFSPKATDFQETIEGKLNALRRINDAARSKVTRLQDLSEKYGSLDAIPDSELLKYSQESEKEIDNFIAQPVTGVSNSESTKTFEKLPAAKQYKSGTRIRDTDTGKTYVSDGSKWSVVR